MTLTRPDEDVSPRYHRTQSASEMPQMPPPMLRQLHSAPALIHEDLDRPRRSISETPCPAHESNLVGMCSALAMRTPLALLLLEDPDSRVRLRALDGMRQLDSPELLAQYGSAVAPLVQDPAWEVRERALEVLSGVPPAVVVPHACTIASCMCDMHWPVRRAAVCLLAQLPAPTLVLYAGAIASLLSDPAWSVRWHAVQALTVLEEAAARDPNPKASHKQFSRLVKSARDSLCAELEKRSTEQSSRRSSTEVLSSLLDGAEISPKEPRTNTVSADSVISSPMACGA